MKSFIPLIATSEAFRDFTDYTFEQFQQEFKGLQASQETTMRRELFNAELAKVLEQNEMYKAGQSTWWATINQFSDLSTEEFNSMMTGKAPSLQGQPSGRLGKAQNPSRKDWREEGVVTPVKDQGGCGSCWAFAATECVESHYNIASGSQAILAPQYYVNCVVNENECGGSGGCQGAIAQLAFNLTAKVGIPLESDLPYEGRNGACGTYPEAVTCDGYTHLSPNDPDELETALATTGPVSVSVAANWGRYGGGVFSGGCTSSSCSINHAVLAVGYDTDYWLIRNSWGKNWGEGGYIRLSRKYDKTEFTDNRPQDGFACKPYPASQQVAGESGVLSDSAFPTNVRKASFNSVSV